MNLLSAVVSLAALLACSSVQAHSGPFDTSLGVRGVQAGALVAFAGKADAACLGIDAGEDYLVGRIETNYLFGDGFDGIRRFRRSAMHSAARASTT